MGGLGIPVEFFPPAPYSRCRMPRMELSQECQKLIRQMHSSKIVRAVRLGERNGFIACCHEKIKNPAWVRNIRDSYGFNLILAGRGVYRDETNRCHSFVAGDCYHRLPGLSHEILLDATVEAEEIFFALDILTARQMISLGVIPTADRVIQTSLQPFVIQRIASLHQHLISNRDISPMDVTGFVSDLFGMLHNESVERGRKHHPEAPMIRHARQRLEECNARPVPLGRIAQECKVSYITFRRLFRLHTGVSPGEYRNRKRLEKAFAMLGSKSVKETAFDLHYSTPYGFARQFKRYFGFPPGRLRQRRQS